MSARLHRAVSTAAPSPSHLSQLLLSSLSCPRCTHRSYTTANQPATAKAVRRPIKLTFARPSPPTKKSSLISTSPPPPFPPPRSPRPPSSSTPQLRPSHFLKQFFLRIHPDLFHSPTATVTHSSLPSSSSSADDELDEVVTAGVEEVKEEQVDTATMRQVNEDNMAKLNELMGYYKQLQSFGEHTPVVSLLPRPPSLAPFQFYARLDDRRFTFFTHRCELPSSHTPIILIHSIDRFLTRLLLSSGIPLPSSLLTQWRDHHRSHQQHHRYGRMRRHMPWMFDETRKESESKQVDMVRRDVRQDRLHMKRMGVRERGEHYVEWMYRVGLVKFDGELSEEEVMRAMQYWKGLIVEFGGQLKVEEWLGSEVRVGREMEGYGWGVGWMQVPWSMQQKEVWELCQQYVKEMRRVKEELTREVTTVDELTDHEVAQALGGSGEVVEGVETTGEPEWVETAASTGGDGDWGAGLEDSRAKWMEQKMRSRV